MSIDMSQFYQVFFDETTEHLASMEGLLLDLDVDQPSLEDLNAIFRAAHSIKGGSGTFGFTDMSDVTHVLESVLDRLRKESLRLRPDMVDAFLATGDVLRAQLAHHQGGAAVDAAQVTAVCARLQQLAADEAAAPAASAQVEPAVETAPAPDMAPAPSAPPPDAPHLAPARRLRLICTLPPDTAADGRSVDHLLVALGELAALDLLHRPDAGDPRLVVILTTCQDDAALAEALSFYAAPDAIAFSDADASAPVESPVAVDETPDAGFGLFDDAPGRPEQLPSREVSPGDSPAALEGEGYGLFVDAPGGMGLFAGAPGGEALLPAFSFARPGKAPSEAGVGRRLADHPAIERAKAGRRDSDKTVSAANSDSSIRVAVEKVDQLMNLVGELVITQAMLAQVASQIDPAHGRLLAGIEQLARNTRDMQESVMSIRMLPVSMVFSRFPRLVRDLAAKLGKQVDFLTYGENTELDKGLIEKIVDPLTHLVRNSLDHGIEIPERRVAAGKKPHGTLKLRAAHQGGNIVIEVIDDGAGLDRERILAKALERGLPVSEAMSDHEVWQLIFTPGFSTAEAVTDVSGRGVGMDVVRRNIEELGGRVELECAPGHGTRTIIRLPLTLAILDGMCVGVGGETFIVPITSVVESLQPSPADLHTLAGDSRMLHLRDDYLPLIALAEIFGLNGVEDIAQGIVVVVEGDDGKAALLVDELQGQQQVVIKSLEANYRRVEGVSGATIMGDGRVALILDVAALTRMGLAQPRGRRAA